jgi:hypothetical protein
VPPSPGTDRREPVERGVVPLSREQGAGPRRSGARYIAAIGIDRYRAWSPLANAVNDARGATTAFERLGFQRFGSPLFDEAATSDALRQLVVDDLHRLTVDDSLILFFAGHGFTRQFQRGKHTVRQGYIIPFDADEERPTSWVDLDAWLKAVDLLPPRHILIILDACHSGIALNEVLRWRGKDIRLADPLDQLRARQSRRVITSALDTQRALDGGPFPGHSLFTGCLIEALTGGLAAKAPRPAVTGSEIWLHVRNRIMEYPGGTTQTPDYGALTLDDRGELVVELPRPEHFVDGQPRRDPRGEPSGPIESVHGAERAPVVPGPDSKGPPRFKHSARDRGAEQRPLAGAHVPGVAPDFVADLDRHDHRRRLRGAVVSHLVGDEPATAAAWATWATHRDYLPLLVTAASPAQGVAAVLATFPWLRCAAGAQAALAAARALAETAIAPQPGGAHERPLADGARGREAVAKWLVQALSGSEHRVPELAGAPLAGEALLAALGELVVPIAILVRGARSAEDGGAGALMTAETLARHLPDHAIAVASPRAPDLAALTATLPVRGRASAADHLPTIPTPEAARHLLDALNRDPRTAQRFRQRVPVDTARGARAFELDLHAPDARLAVCVETWHANADLTAYARARERDALLRRAGLHAVRVTTEEIGGYPDRLVDELAVLIDTCRTS